MKHLILLFSIIATAYNSLAQQPTSEPLIYSNVARTSRNKPVAGKTIAIQISILKASATGTVVYKENQLASTDFFGNFNLTIGTGAVQSGTFDNINWNTDNYYLSASLDTNAGSDFKMLEAPRQLHIPYSLYTRSTGTQTGGDSGLTGFKHYIGELYGGGIVFNFWKDSKGTEHGLIVALNDQGDSVPWNNIETTAIGHAAQSVWNGATNTAAIIAQQGQVRSAAQICRKYAGGGYHDWYLPSTDELNLLYSNRVKVKKGLAAGGKPIGNNIYWSSTEAYSDSAWVFAVYGGTTNNYVFSKYSTFHVRAIRAF